MGSINASFPGSTYFCFLCANVLGSTEACFLSAESPDSADIRFLSIIIPGSKEIYLLRTCYPSSTEMCFLSGTLPSTAKSCCLNANSADNIELCFLISNSSGSAEFWSLRTDSPGSTEISPLSTNCCGSRDLFSQCKFSSSAEMCSLSEHLPAVQKSMFSMPIISAAYHFTFSVQLFPAVFVLSINSLPAAQLFLSANYPGSAEVCFRSANSTGGEEMVVSVRTGPAVWKCVFSVQLLAVQNCTNSLGSAEFSQ